MEARLLIVPFQIETYVTNNKNTPDKNCVRISPDYAQVEYTSYLGGKMEPPPFTAPSPLPAGVHLHFILPGCFRRAVQKQSEKDGMYFWDYARVPDRWIVTRMVQQENGELSYKCFIVESNYIGLDNTKSVAIPYLYDKDVSHRFLGRRYAYQENTDRDDDADNYLNPFTAMGAGDPYFSAYYPNCYSVFGFYDDMSGVEIKSDVSYFVSGYFSDRAGDPFYQATEKTFPKIMEEMGFRIEDKSFYTDHCVLFGEVCNLRWMGYSADYPDGRPKGEIGCGIGNTSSEVISALISRITGEKGEPDKERLFNALQYEMAEDLDKPEGITRAEDAIHARTFAHKDGGRIWKLEYQDGDADKLPKGAGSLLAALNRAARLYYKKQDELSYWQDAVYAAWYSYMLRYEGNDDPSAGKKEMQKEILRLCKEVIPKIQKEAAQEKKTQEGCLEALKKCLEGTGILPVTVPDDDFLEPKEPVLMLYGEGLKRNYAFADEGNILCQTSPVMELSGGKKTLQKADILKYAGQISEIIPGFSELFAQAMCLNRKIVEMIGKKEEIPSLFCDKSGVSELVCREFEQSWLTFLMEWKLSFYPSRTLSEEKDDSMKFWEFDGLDYDNGSPNRETAVIYSGRNMLTPHSLFQFRYVAEKYLSAYGEPNEEIKKALEEVEKLPLLSQNLDGLNRQFLSRRQSLQAPIIGNDSDQELTKIVSNCLSVPLEKAAVNDVLPFFPLRAGHIHIEKVNVVSTFGRVQNAFSEGMVPICSEVMGEYKEQQHGRTYGLLRPRIAGAARFRLDFVTAKDERITAEPAPDTTPVCGIIMPELLNGRLALYSAEGSYYGSLKTVHRRGKRRAAWLSPPGQAEVGFEDIAFEDENFKNIVRYLLKDSEKGGTAYEDFFALIAQHLDKSLPSGMNLGEELPYLWGRPLAVFRCRASLERQGGLAYSQLQKDYAKYHDLSVGKIGFKLMAGDMDRPSSGIVGYYENNDPAKLYPAYNADAFASDYIRFGETTELCINGEEKLLTLISEIGSTLYFQTGILPVASYTLPEIHTRSISKIKLCFEADSIVCIPQFPEIPVPVANTKETWYFEYTDRHAEGEKNKKAEISGIVNTFHEERAIVCDGYLTLEKKEDSDTEKGR